MSSLKAGVVTLENAKKWRHHLDQWRYITDLLDHSLSHWIELQEAEEAGGDRNWIEEEFQELETEFVALLEAEEYK